MKKLTNIQEKEIASKYGVVSKKELSREYGITVGMIISIASKANRTTTFKLTEEIEESIIYWYNEGFSNVDIAVKIGCSTDTISSTLIKNGLTYKNRRKVVNYNPFENYTNPNVQYWLGVLATDGCISENTRISLGQCEAHKDLIDKFCKFLKYKIVPSERKFKKFNKEFVHYHVQFRNKQIYDFLNIVGITPRKTDTLKMNIPITFDFLRGAIDGDGSIEENHMRIRLASNSLEFLNQIIEFLKTFDIKCNLYSYQNRVAEIQILDRLNLLKLIEYLYYDDCTYYLNDKYNNAQRLRNKLLTRFKFRELSSENPEPNQ